MVLGLTYNQLPLVNAAIEMGYRVVAAGLGGGPDVVSKACHQTYPIDFSLHNLVIKIAESEGIDGIVTCGTSTGMCTVAKVTDALKLSNKVISPETAAIATYKDQTRSRVSRYMPKGVVSSKVMDALEDCNTLRLPLVLKPADGGGGKGVRIVESLSLPEFKSAFAYTQSKARSKVIIVEEFLNGPVIGVESFVLDGKIKMLSIVDKVVSDPPTVSLGVVFPSQLSESLQREIELVNEKVIRELGIEWGATHIDMVIDDFDGPKVIDVGPRLAGGPLMSHLMSHAYSYDFHKATIELAIGDLPDSIGKRNQLFYGSRFMAAKRVGVLRDIRYTAKSLEENSIDFVQQLIPSGTKVCPAVDDQMRCLVFTTSAESPEKLTRNLNSFEQCVELIFSE